MDPPPYTRTHARARTHSHTHARAHLMLSPPPPPSSYLQWGTIPIVTLIGMLLLGIDEMGIQIEEPL